MPRFATKRPGRGIGVAGALAFATLLLADGLASASAPAGPAASRGPDFVRDEVVVGRRGGGERVVELERGTRPAEAIRRLAARPGVAYAARNWIATAAVEPIDGGTSMTPGGWIDDQWNFLGGAGGIRALPAWKRADDAGRPGGEDVTVAVVDTGVAYTDHGSFAISPGFTGETEFAPGRDFIDGDLLPLDENGHGTHIAGTIAEQVNLEGSPLPPDGRDYLTGIAYGATLMPVRVLDAAGTGTAADVSRGIRWAAKRGADIINLSLQVSSTVRRCPQIRNVCRAIRDARKEGALVIAAAGNSVGAQRPVAFPAAAPGVVAVGASTESGCLAAYSHRSRRLDLLAPGGGVAMSSVARRRCRDDDAPIRQVSLACFGGTGPCSDFTEFGIRSTRGTSMAAAHVSGVAALARATRAAGANPGPGRLRNWLRCTARPLGRPRFHGFGRLDAGRATRDRPPARC